MRRALGFVALLAGCGGGNDYGSAPAGSGTQITWDVTLGALPECLSRPVPVEDGAAVCRILVELEDDAACPEASGWLDPLRGGTREPRTVETAAGPRRICEIQQLEGAALQACRSSADCSGCEPGWCVTERAELLAACDGSYPFPFRFAAGSGDAAPGSATITCIRSAPASD